MSKETTIKTQLPKLRFPEFMDMGKWEKKLVEEYFNVGSSKRVFQKDWVNDGVPFYRTRELVSLSKNESFGREIYISEELFLELSEKHGVPTKGDFLVSGVGTIGVSYQVKSGDKFYFKDGNVLWFKLLQGLVSDYFKYCLQSQIIQSQILGKASISTVGTYTIQNAKKTEFWLAYSPDEQQKIADCLSSIDDLITAQAQKIESLKDHKKGLMQQLFPAEGETVPKLRFPEFRNAEDWDKKLLSDVCERFSSTILANTLVNEGNFKVYGASGYFQNVNFYKEEKTYIGIVKDGSGVGRSFICEGKSSVLSTLQIIKPKGQNNLIFIWKLIKKINFSKYVAGGAIPHIYFKDYSKENITTPLPDEQKKIADCLSSLDNLITAQAQKVESLKAHKKGLMQQLFPAEGETVPKLRFPEFLNTSDWKPLKLSELSHRITEKVGEKKLTTVSITAGYGFVSQAEKFSRDISGKQYKNYIHLKIGEFSYNKGNSKKFAQGCIYKLKEFEEVAVPGAFISFKFKDAYVSDFYQGYFDNNAHGKQLLRYITSGARSDGLLNIKPDVFFSIVLPSPEERYEQQKIADCLSSLDNLISAQTQKVESLKAHKKGLMQQLFPVDNEGDM